MLRAGILSTRMFSARELMPTRFNPCDGASVSVWWRLQVTTKSKGR